MQNDCVPFYCFHKSTGWVCCLRTRFTDAPWYNDLDFRWYHDIMPVKSSSFLGSNFSTRALGWFSCSFAEKTCVLVETIFPLGVSDSVWTPLLSLLHQLCTASSELRRMKVRAVEQTSRGTQCSLALLIPRRLQIPSPCSSRLPFTIAHGANLA